MPPPRSNNPAIAAAALTAASLAGVVGTLYYLDIPSLLSQRIASRTVPARCYSVPDTDSDKKDGPSLAALQVLTSQITLQSTYPLAIAVERNIPIYDCALFDIHDEALMERLKDEWAHIHTDGPGVYILKRFFAGDEGKKVIEEANEVFEGIIAKEQQQQSKKQIDNDVGDHFAPPSANVRVWNSFSKHGLASPRNFYDYHSNLLFPHVCKAHLGPFYRMTTQLNIVRPGGKAQGVHRDYHLSFQIPEVIAQFPKAMHTASARLTLQGAVAHADMPLESGPTRFLPFSQLFDEGYMAFRQEDFQAYFAQNYVSLAMEQGDAVFFSPAIFHGAGENVTKDIERTANLCQVSAAFGKPMESVDALPLVEAAWEHVRAEVQRQGGVSEQVDAWIQAVAEGYPFPTNLDRRPPAPNGAGLAPESEQQLLRRGLTEGWGTEKIVSELTEMRETSQA